jgi:deoxynucleoside kinase
MRIEPRSPLRIQIEGNIAAGKSTLIENLKEKKSSVLTLPEPIEKWKNTNGKNLLDVMYKEPKKYTCEFQLMTQDTLYESINSEIEDNEILIIERSMYSSQFIFTVKAFNDGNLTYKEYIKITKRFKAFEEESIKPNLMIYLRSDPKLCFKRLKGTDQKKEMSL